MDATEIIRACLDDSPKSARQVCREMGRTETFLSSQIATKRIPTIKLMAEIANTTGHDLLLRNRETGNEIIVDPPEK